VRETGADAERCFPANAKRDSPMIAFLERLRRHPETGSRQRLCTLSYLPLMLIPLTPSLAAAQMDVAWLKGAWAHEARQCSEVFVRRGDTISFRPGHPSRDGMLVDRRVRFRDGEKQCAIARINPDGDGYKISLTCFSGMTVSTSSFSARVIDADSLARSPPSSPGEQIRFRRCRL
jgi:hypothetical protein